jgi:capsular exopolysaccharide synthesis family protein
MKEPSPYFIRRNLPPAKEEEAILVNDYVAVEEESPRFWEYWRVIRGRQWLILACTFATLLAAALFTFSRTPIYTAQATLLIERKPPLVLKLQDALAESAEQIEYYQTQYEILKSRALAAQIIRDDGLENHSLFGGGQGEEEMKRGFVTALWAGANGWVKDFFSTPAGPMTNDKDPLGVKPEFISAYLSMLEIKPVRGTSLVNVRLSTPDPALSARLANDHPNAYIRYILGLRSRANSEALTFLERKLLELKERVEKSEAALNSYRRDKGIISLDNKENIIVDRLADLNKRLTEAEALRIALEAQLRPIRKGTHDPFSAVINSPVIQSLRRELGRLEAEYAQLSSEFKPGYPRLDKVRIQIEDTRRALMKEIDTEVKGIESAYLAAKVKEEALRAKMEEQKRATLNLKDSAVEYAILAREVDTNRQLYDSVLQRMKEMGVAAQVHNSNVTVVDKADLPLLPSYPKKSLYLLLGLLLGLGGGVGIAFFLEHLDNTFKTPEEAERYLRLPNLGVVPDFLRLNNSTYGYVSKAGSHARPQLPVAESKDSGKEIVLSHHPLSVIAEAYRAFRTSILLSQAGEPPQTILITSATRGEGKTVTVINTAITFTQMGVRVLIIDADLRRSRCHKLLGMENGIGLTELLTGQRGPQEVIKPTATDNLFLLSGGSAPPNPAELLGSRKMHETLTSLREHYDFILIDSSPIMPVSESLLLSTMVDGVLLVVDGAKTPKQVVREARSRLGKARSKILGVMLNRVDARNGGYAYYYRHYYSYYHDDSTEESNEPLV